MEALILCGIYLIELICYYFGLRILFEVKQKSWTWIIAGIFVTIVIGVLPIRAASKNVLVTISVMGVMFLSIEGRVKETAIKVLLGFLLLECMDFIFSQPCKIFLKFIGVNYDDDLYYFVTKCCVVISILLLNLVKEKIISYKQTYIHSGIYIILSVIAASMMLCIGILDQVSSYLFNERFTVLCAILNTAIFISIFLLVVFVIYIKKTHERMEQLLRTERILKEAQVNYYKQILKKEADTRQYRHDMVGHLVYIRNVLKKNRKDDAQRYLERIIGGFEEIQNTYYVTGNEMVDTIMNYFFGMLPKDVEIIIKGRCLNEIDMEDTDVCTIFSNLFQNAVEEIVEHHTSNMCIIIEVQKGTRYVKYCIINSLVHKINEEAIDKNGLPKSHKLNKRNHGIGMLNVKNAIEKGIGSFEWYQKEKYFCVEVILPLK